MRLKRKWKNTIKKKSNIGKASVFETSFALPGIVSSDSYTCYFQYKVLNNVLYLNEKLFFFGISETSQYFFGTKIRKQFSISFVTALLGKLYGMI